MSDIQSVPNHTIDPATGFIESLGYASAFDAERKTSFLKIYRENGLGLYKTCEQMGLSHDTINRHYRLDPVFKEAMDDLRRRYLDELERVSRTNALEPKMVIERIFQLKSLLPEKYADQKGSGSTQITVNIDGKLLETMKKRDEIIEAQVITSTLQQKSNGDDSQQF